MSRKTLLSVAAVVSTAVVVLAAAPDATHAWSGHTRRLHLSETTAGSAVPDVLRTRQQVARLKPTVIVISVDGFNQDAITALPKPQTRWLRALRTYGTSTTNARTAYAQTNTLPNHAGMITGRRIEGPAGHHVSFNSEVTSSTIARSNGGRYIASMFDVAHDRGMSTAMYASKTKFQFLNRSYDHVHGAPDPTGADNGRDKIDSFYLARPDAVAAHLVSSLKSAHRRNLYFWHLSAPDDAGHQHGFMSAKYLTAIAHTDKLLGRMLTAVNATKTLRSSTTVILTADHGGLGASHRDPTKVYNYKIPFYTWGRGVASGPRLYAKNPTYRYPGKQRINYTGRQPIRNHDAANTALRLLHLPALREATPALTTH